MAVGDVSRPGDKKIAFRGSRGEDDAIHMIEVCADGNVLLIAIRKLDVIIVARVQVGVPGIIGILIAIDEEGVQLLIARAVDPSAITKHQHITSGAVQFVIKKSGREQVSIVPGERRVFYNAIAQLMPVGAGVLQS